MRKRKNTTPKMFYIKTNCQKVYPLPPMHVVHKAYHLLFGNAGANADAAKIFTYIMEHYARMGSCVLWKRNSVFLKLCEETGLDSKLGDQEVIINETFEILYSDDYHNDPVLITIS